jgi:hypothetical protein
VGAFAEWAVDWMTCATYRGRDVPGVDRRIEGVLARWDAAVPGVWRRNRDERILVPGRRYCRTHTGGTRLPRGEHKIEHQILDPDPRPVTTAALGMRLVDGVNAVPLAKDEGGARAGNVEADMLLLVRDDGGEPHQLLVEVKDGRDTAWYAAVENLRQLRLFVDSRAAQEIFVDRGTATAPPPVRAVVLAPPAYYTAAGAKAAAVDPARRLLEAFTAHTGIPAGLATWDPTLRTITAR